MTCIAKTTEAYFTETEREASCRGKMIPLGRFWLSHESGNLEAEICELHASWAKRLGSQSYLVQKLQELR